MARAIDDSISIDITPQRESSDASWLEPVTFNQRLVAFGWRAGIAFALACWVTYMQLSEKVQDLRLLWGFGITAFGLVMGIRAFRKREVLVYATSVVEYSQTDRLRRSAKWFVPTIGLLALIWTVQILHNQFKENWWFAWPALLPLVVAVGLYRLRSEKVLSGAGQYARASDEATKKAAKARERDKAST
jgi:hypothetical protein